MINVSININDEGRVESFDMSGHALFDEHGRDIVCAGASAVVFGSVNAIINMTESAPSIQMDEDTGYFSFTAPDAPDEKMQVLLEGMIISLKTIEEEYGEHIRLVYK
ncbi:ribosomal-processing cysteine protease Prp [Salinicoccus carnicancri]|uniref:ribosomal-processing cysteine protease Prp n=1 Tax=Salinicoccus carnicancri TaxID=558170 RepID=UPI0003147D90|nr:ribosomal-processing cysteine protease Prp [Salinicoccus carnicancri]